MQYITVNNRMTTYIIKDGKILVQPIVTARNWVEEYNGRLEFNGVEDLVKWLQSR